MNGPRKHRAIPLLPGLWAVMAALLGLLLAGEVRAQSSDGSILRQLSAIEGKADASGWGALPFGAQSSEAINADYQTPDGMPAPFPQGDNSTEPYWSSPHGMSTRPMAIDDGNSWSDFLPEGCWPWGPRTPNEHRHLGILQPLDGTSWRNRPFSAGWAVGGFWGDDPLDSQADLEPGIYGIYRLGWDYDHYWGVEARLGQATPGVYTPAGYRGTADVTLFDVSVLWYPAGDTRWRPYVCFGMGLQHFNLRDQNYHVHNDSVFSLPVGIGLKWMYSPWIIVRMELTDNWAMGNDRFDMMHNGALTGGVEVRFGGRRPSYWPWNPNRVIY